MFYVCRSTFFILWGRYFAAISDILWLFAWSTQTTQSDIISNLDVGQSSMCYSLWNPPFWIIAHGPENSVNIMYSGPDTTWWCTTMYIRNPNGDSMLLWSHAWVRDSSHIYLGTPWSQSAGDRDNTIPNEILNEYCISSA